MNDTARWQELDSRHHLHPFTDHKALASVGSRIITRPRAAGFGTATAIAFWMAWPVSGA